MRPRVELLGFAEVVEFLGIPERTVARYMQREDFPEPLARLAAGPVWLRGDIDQWARNRPPARGKQSRQGRSRKSR